MWHFIESRWNGETAANSYEGPVLDAQKKAFPRKRRFAVLEDNDPSGFKSSKGHTAKVRAKIDEFNIPKRSPDLNVCDYALWKEVSKRMRGQERKFPTGKRETRTKLLKRLRRTAPELAAVVRRQGGWGSAEEVPVAPCCTRWAHRGERQSPGVGRGGSELAAGRFASVECRPRTLCCPFSHEALFKSIR